MNRFFVLAADLTHARQLAGETLTVSIDRLHRDKVILSIEVKGLGLQRAMSRREADQLDADPAAMKSTVADMAKSIADHILRQALPADIHRRNAWLRAWVGCGLPLRALWTPPPSSQDWIALRLGCTVCERHGHATGGDLLFADYEALERKALKRVDCIHLAPMLWGTPKEHQAIFDLELLASH